MFVGEDWKNDTALQDHIMDFIQSFLDKSSSFEMLSEEEVRSGILYKDPINITTDFIAPPQPPGKTPPPTPTMNDTFNAAVQSFIDTHIQDGSIPKDGQILLFFPAGIVTFASYHDETPNSKVPYCVFPYGGNVYGPWSTTDIGSTMNGLGPAVQHEIAEMLTDYNRRGWHDSNGQEIGDLCDEPPYKYSATLVTKKYGDKVPLQPLWDKNTGTCRYNEGPVSSSTPSTSNQGLGTTRRNILKGVIPFR